MKNKLSSVYKVNHIFKGKSKCHCSEMNNDISKFLLDVVFILCAFTLAGDYLFTR